MKTATRPQYHRLQRILELIREGIPHGSAAYLVPIPSLFAPMNIREFMGANRQQSRSR